MLDTFNALTIAASIVLMLAALAFAAKLPGGVVAIYRSGGAIAVPVAPDADRSPPQTQRAMFAE